MTAAAAEPARIRRQRGRTGRIDQHTVPTQDVDEALRPFGQVEARLRQPDVEDGDAARNHSAAAARIARPIGLAGSANWPTMSK